MNTTTNINKRVPEEDTAGWRVKKFDFPLPGDRYWSREEHRVRIATTSMEERYLILEPEIHPG